MVNYVWKPNVMVNEANVMSFTSYYVLITTPCYISDSYILVQSVSKIMQKNLDSYSYVYIAHYISMTGPAKIDHVNTTNCQFFIFTLS